jgi:hypothetical protein
MAKEKQKSRTARWQEFAERATEALEELRGDLERLDEIMTDWRGLQEEYQEWLDNQPESFSSTATGEKLEAVVDLDLEPDLNILGEIESIISEAEGIELPQGFGRD